MAGTLTPTTTTPCVLIVEDNKDGRDTLKLLLMLHGASVQTASDGLEGVRKGMETRPVAAIIDIGLPGMSGYDVAGQLRSMFQGNILLIAYTGYAEPAEYDRARKAGFDVLLSKMTEPQELLRVLRTGTSLPLKNPAA